MSETIFYYTLIAGIIGILIYKSFYTHEAIVKRKLRKTKARKIFNFKNDETAKVTGKVKYLGKTLEAPLSGRKCVYYHVLVEVKVSSGNHSNWSKLIEEEVAGDVVINDGGDYAIIKTGKVKSYLVQDANYSSGFLNDATIRLEKYLTKHGHKSEGFLGMNKTIRYKEGVLEEDEVLTVVGKAMWMKKNQVRLNIPSEKVLLIVADGEEPVYFSDDIGV